MASPPGAQRAASSRGTPSPAPFPVTTHFPSRAAGLFLRQHHLPADSDGDAAVEEVDEDEDGMDDGDDEAELVDGAACSYQQRCASSPVRIKKNFEYLDEGDYCCLLIHAPGIGRAVMNGENGVRQIQEEEQWQHSHIYNCGNEQYGRASSRGDEPGTTPREMRVENGYGVIGRREGGPASSYWDLLRAHLSDPLTGVLMDDAMILSCGHSYGSSGMQHIYRMIWDQTVYTEFKLMPGCPHITSSTSTCKTSHLFALQFRHLNAKKIQQKH